MGQKIYVNQPQGATLRFNQAGDKKIVSRKLNQSPSRSTVTPAQVVQSAQVQQQQQQQQRPMGTSIQVQPSLVQIKNQTHLPQFQNQPLQVSID